MKRIVRVVILLLVSIILLSCATAPLTERKQLKFVSDESVAKESELAYSKMVGDWKEQKVLANTTEDGKRLQVIGNRMATVIEKYLNENGMSDKVKNLQWEFNLVKSEDVNAFALPGGKIAFYTAILPILKTDAGIAYVMGHEIGHVIGGHHAEGQSGKIAAGIVMIGKELTDTLTGGKTEVINDDLVDQGLSLGLLKFNRTQEYEADKYGMIFMAMAGYDPAEAIKAEENLMAVNEDQPIELLSTHPASEKRVEQLKKFLPEALKYYKK